MWHCIYLLRCIVARCYSWPPWSVPVPLSARWTLRWSSRWSIRWSLWLSVLLPVTALPLSVPVTAAELIASAEHHPIASAAGDGVAERRQGALYRVSGHGQVSYLFGTVHAGTSAFYPLAPAISRAMADAGELVVELDTRSDAAFQQAVAAHGRYPAGDSVRRHLQAETLAALTHALHAVGITVSSVEQLKPWLLANLLMGLELERSGYQRRFGLETYLLETARQHGTSVSALESADYQLALFDTLGDVDGERYLRDALRALSDGSSLRKARALMQAWNAGDVAAFDTLMADATGDGSAMAQFTRHTLLDRRNPEMAQHIARMMEQRAVRAKDARPTFVGVGLLHLLGPNGLPQLLRQRGFEVTRVESR